MGTEADLRVHRLDHARMRVTQQQRPMPAKVIDILVAVGVPFPSPLGSLDIEGVRLHVPGIVNDTARKHLARFQMPGLRLARPLLEGGDDL